jgi:membrane protease YdiL (CAAX protease family)
MGVGAAIVLGLCAGIGEEVLVRGALQPRVGLVAASLLFACAHVQYTWFGILTVGLLGVALGILRARTNTTVAIVVHSLYDVLAALQAN